MSPEDREFVINMANDGADLQLQLIEENFLGHEAFDPLPTDEESLQAAWESFCYLEDEPWWHLLESVVDELDEEDHESAKELLVETFTARIMEGLRAHLGLG